MHENFYIYAITLTYMYALRLDNATRQCSSTSFKMTDSVEKRLFTIYHQVIACFDVHTYMYAYTCIIRMGVMLTKCISLKNSANTATKAFSPCSSLILAFTVKALLGKKKNWHTAIGSILSFPLPLQPEMTREKQNAGWVKPPVNKP